jgi:hypothetical protein
LHLGKSDLATSRATLDRFFAEINTRCANIDKRFAEKYPKDYQRLMRCRYLFEHDDALQRNLIFHNAQEPALGSVPDPQDEGLRKFIKAMIYGDPGEEPPYKTLKVRAMAAHGHFTHDSFMGLAMRVNMTIANWLPRSFVTNDRNLPLFRVLATVVTFLIWPFYFALKSLRRK